MARNVWREIGARPAEAFLIVAEIAPDFGGGAREDDPFDTARLRFAANLMVRTCTHSNLRGDFAVQPLREPQALVIHCAVTDAADFAQLREVVGATEIEAGPWRGRCHVCWTKPGTSGSSPSPAAGFARSRASCARGPRARVGRPSALGASLTAGLAFSLDTGSTLHLCIDMQRLFAEETPCGSRGCPAFCQPYARSRVGIQRVPCSRASCRPQLPLEQPVPGVITMRVGRR